MQKTGNRYNVVKQSDGKVVGHKLSKVRAQAMLRALYANVHNADKSYPAGVDMKVAKKVDLIILPGNVKGTNCGNCKWIANDFCENPKVKQPVNSGMCCALWDRKDIQRPWGKEAIKVNEADASNLAAGKNRVYKKNAKKKAIQQEANSKFCTMTSTKKQRKQELADQKQADKAARNPIAKSQYENTFWIKTAPPPKLVKAKVMNQFFKAFKEFVEEQPTLNAWTDAARAGAALNHHGYKLNSISSHASLYKHPHGHEAAISSKGMWSHADKHGNVVIGSSVKSFLGHLAKVHSKKKITNNLATNDYPLYGQTRCPNCGHKIPRNSVVCPFCGYQLKNKLTAMELADNTWSDAARAAARLARSMHRAPTRFNTPQARQAHLARFNTPRANPEGHKAKLVAVAIKHGYQPIADKRGRTFGEGVQLFERGHHQLAIGHYGWNHEPAHGHDTHGRGAAHLNRHLTQFHGAASKVSKTGSSSLKSSTKALLHGTKSMRENYPRGSAGRRGLAQSFRHSALAKASYAIMEKGIKLNGRNLALIGNTNIMSRKAFVDQMLGKRTNTCPGCGTNTHSGNLCRACRGHVGMKI